MCLHGYVAKTHFIEVVQRKSLVFCVWDTNLDTFPTNLSNHSASPPRLSQHHHNCDTATMGGVKPCRDDKEHGKSISLAGMIGSTGNRFALPNKILLMEPNPLFTLQHATTTFPTQYWELAYMDCKYVLKQIEGLSYLVYRKRKL